MPNGRSRKRSLELAPVVVIAVVVVVVVVVGVVVGVVGRFDAGGDLDHLVRMQDIIQMCR